MGVYGQDWASYQSSAPSASGLSFVFVKVTEGLSYVNPKWVAQRDHAKANGLVWGAYHYPHMGNSVQAEADYFLSQVAWQPGDLIVLDWEGYDAANAGVSRARQAEYKDAWLRYVKGRMPHLRVGMYANTDYWRNVDQSGYFGDFLWIATGGRAAGDPGIQADWLFHQYSEAGGLDRDYCHLDAGALRAWALGTQPPQQQHEQEDDMPEPIDLWAYRNKDAEAAARKASGGRAGIPDAYGYLVGTYANTAAMGAAINTLAKALGDVKGVDTAALISAVQTAIKDAVVDVDVTVHGTTPTV
ncbi:glycoside hydrolase family 25 protein [Streptomyces sp. NPDC002506]|uniref:glycoside hydrolase family 25 protein n=1 Tax=Streptomyces sp. NPDC002506 TaxID=3154536 RepID=UPI00332E9098